jgi:hypothetical protein
MSKQAIVSFANEKGYYMQRLARLSESLRNNLDGDFIGFVGEASCGAPLHSDNPYAFKIHAIERVLEQGYTKILWLDSSCFAIKNVDPLFEYIEKYGHIAQDSGHYLGTWCNDETLYYYGLTREQAIKIKMIGNAGFLGLDFNHPSSQTFFNAWREAMKAGMFKGSWDNHRHDMSCSSASWHGMGFNMVAGDEWLQYAGPYDETLNETIIIKAQG